MLQEMEIKEQEMDRTDDLRQEMKPDHNIVVFGETGCGKSSIVNMIVGDVIANGAGAGFFRNELYEADIDGTSFRIFDTAGLNEGDEGRVPHWKAVEGLYTLIRQLDGVSLLVFCVRGRIKENTRANWILFNKVICGEVVPTIVVVTGLEDEVNLDDWWNREENKDVFRRYKMKPKGVSCVVSIRGQENQYAGKYRESQEKVRKLILDSYRREPWSKERDAWFSQIYSEVYHAGICFFTRKSKEFTTVMRNAFDEFVREVNMDEGDSEKLKKCLLHAEKTIEKGEGKMRDSREHKTAHNIIVFGEAGCGKSSIVNMIVGNAVAQVSNSAGGSCFHHELYEADIDGTSFRIFDTAGLNEGDEGRVPDWKSVQGLYTLIRQLDGVSLLVFCVRGRINANTRANWVLFNKVICGETVPAIMVVTGLEGEANLDDWWRREENKEVLRRYKLRPRGVSCVVSIRGQENQYAEKYRESQEKVRNLILNSYRREPWSKERDAWFSQIYSEVYHAGICSFTRRSKEFTSVMRNAFDEFVREVNMDEGDSEKLKRCLLQAEKIIEKKGLRRRRLL